MQKKLPALALACALLLSILTGCSPSPTAVTVGDHKVDASEYAFYLHYNRLSTGEDSGTILYDEEDNADAKAAALEQIVTNEIVRLKCEEFGLTLSDAQKEALEKSKATLIDSLGGTSAYLDYLKQSLLTDRAYEKFHENNYYSDMLYEYMREDSKTYFTDEALRRYFSEHYAIVKYVYISILDNDGERLDKEVRDTLLATAEAVCEAARTADADFEELMEEYNQDVSMTADGFAISELEAASTEYLITLFDLAENQNSDVISTSDGYYILKRCPVPATYYDENQADIFQAACDDRFEESMTAWKTEYAVTVSKIVDKINLSNLSEYVK